MSSLEYARKVLTVAGEQYANREAVVVRRAQQPLNSSDTAPSIETLHVGEVTHGDHRYTGPSGRMTEDDPHQAAYAVCQVERIFKATDAPADANGIQPPNPLRLIFARCYVRLDHPGSEKRTEAELVRMMAEYLGETDDDLTVASNAQRDHRLSRMGQRREYKRHKESQYRARRTAIRKANANLYRDHSKNPVSWTQNIVLVGAILGCFVKLLTLACEESES